MTVSVTKSRGKQSKLS